MRNQEVPDPIVMPPPSRGAITRQPPADATKAGAAGNRALHPAWWQWPTVLSLDAPAISVVWLVLLARTAGVSLEWPVFAVLGLSVWLAYAADRAIEGWRLPPENVRTPRHLFYQRWRRTIVAVWFPMFAIDIALGVTRLSPDVVVRGLILTGAVGAYLISHQFIHRHARWRVPKEICIAGLLTAGAALFLVGSPRPMVTTTALALFAGICLVNCLLISFWERDVDRVHQQTSLALESPHAGLIFWTPWILAGLSAAAGLAIPQVRSVAACAGVSAVLMAAIDRYEHSLGWPLARVLADGALLAPLVPLSFSA